MKKQVSERVVSSETVKPLAAVGDEMWVVLLVVEYQPGVLPPLPLAMSSSSSLRFDVLVPRGLFLRSTPRLHELVLASLYPFPIPAGGSSVSFSRN